MTPERLAEIEAKRLKAMEWLNDDDDVTSDLAIHYTRESAEEDIPDLLARVRELEAITNKLPKTADGVPITPGMILYGWIGEKVASWDTDKISWRAGHDGALPHATWCGCGGMTRLDTYYSTRDAARTQLAKLVKAAEQETTR